MSYDNYSDIESGKITINAIPINTIAINAIAINAIPINTIIIDATNVMPMTELVTTTQPPTLYDKSKNIINFVLIIVAFLIVIFMMVFDIYYGLYDKTCVHNDVNGFSINLHGYLLGSGFKDATVGAWVFLICPCLSGCICFNEKDVLEYCKGILSLSYLFGCIWHIIGSIIFWDKMDNSRYSTIIYNYMTVSLTIKLLACLPLLSCCGSCICECWTCPCKKYNSRSFSVNM